MRVVDGGRAGSCVCGGEGTCKVGDRGLTPELHPLLPHQEGREAGGEPRLMGGLAYSMALNKLFYMPVKSFLVP